MSDKRFATLGSLGGGAGRRRSGSGSGSENDDDKRAREGQSFYVGGSENSGQQVVGPPRDRPAAGSRREEMIEALLRQAQAQGEAHASQARSRSPSPAGAQAAEGGPVIPVVLKLWSNGFSLDDGELRPYDDPANAAFMQQITMGRVPSELARTYRSTNIDLKLEPHREEEYKLPPLKPFTGTGQRLGAVVPTVVGAGTVAPAAASHAAAQSSSCTPPAAKTSELPVDEKLPLGKVQVRLMNDTRLVTRVNPDRHTVADLRRLIVANYPDFEFTPFVLMATFPNRILTDESATVNAAGINNSMIQQKKDA